MNRRIYSLHPRKQNKSIFKNKFVILPQFLQFLNFANLFSFFLKVGKFRDSIVSVMFCYLDYYNYIYQYQSSQSKIEVGTILSSTEQRVKQSAKNKAKKTDHMEIMVGDFGYLSQLNLIEGTVSIMIAVKIMLTAIMTKSFDFCIKRRSI